MQQYELGENLFFPVRRNAAATDTATGLDQAMRFAMEISAIIYWWEPLLCPLAEALATLKAGLLRR